MGVLELCSEASFWKGLNYYENHAVKSMKKTSKHEYDAVVSGSRDYNVHLNIDHPRKSTCTCPFANGRRVICKHMVATYFTVFPSEAKRINAEMEEYYREQEEMEKRREEEMNERKASIKQYVDSLANEEVRRILTNMLVNEAYRQYEQDDDYDDRFY